MNSWEIYNWIPSYFHIDITVKFSQFTKFYSYSFLILFFAYYYHSNAVLYSVPTFFIFTFYTPIDITLLHPCNTARYIKWKYYSVSLLLTITKWMTWTGYVATVLSLYIWIYIPYRIKRETFYDYKCISSKYNCVMSVSRWSICHIHHTHMPVLDCKLLSL